MAIIADSISRELFLSFQIYNNLKVVNNSDNTTEVNFRKWVQWKMEYVNMAWNRKDQNFYQLMNKLSFFKGRC